MDNLVRGYIQNKDCMKHKKNIKRLMPGNRWKPRSGLINGKYAEQKTWAGDSVQGVINTGK
jgi:hypothetical protein